MNQPRSTTIGDDDESAQHKVELDAEGFLLIKDQIDLDVICLGPKAIAQLLAFLNGTP